MNYSMRVQILKFLLPRQVMTCAQLRTAVRDSRYGHNPTHSVLSGVLFKMVENGELKRVTGYGKLGGYGYRLP